MSLLKCLPASASDSAAAGELPAAAAWLPTHEHCPQFCTLGLRLPQPEAAITGCMSTSVQKASSKQSAANSKQHEPRPSAAVGIREHKASKVAHHEPGEVLGTIRDCLTEVRAQLNSSGAHLPHRQATTLDADRSTRASGDSGAAAAAAAAQETNRPAA